MPRTLRTVGLLSLLSTAAFASHHREEPPDSTEPSAPKQEESDAWGRSYTQQFQMGFLTGRRDFSTNTGFVFGGGDGGELSFGQALVDPFGAAPFTGVHVTGLAWDTMVVQNHVRYGFGVAKPFASFRLSDGRSTSTDAGFDQPVSVRSLSLWDLRFSLGGEYTFGRVTPSLDLVGVAEKLSADLTLQGKALSYSAWGFSLTARAGVRVRLDDHMYVAASGNYGFTGAPHWGAEVAVGWALY